MFIETFIDFIIFFIHRPIELVIEVSVCACVRVCALPSA